MDDKTRLELAEIRLRLDDIPIAEAGYLSDDKDWEREQEIVDDLSKLVEDRDRRIEELEGVVRVKCEVLRKLKTYIGSRPYSRQDQVLLDEIDDVIGIITGAGVKPASPEKEG